jgi:hypothetical protein
MQNQQQGGIGCLSIIGIVFVTLKLLGVQPVASWAWAWVLAPFWVPFTIGVVFLGIMFLLSLRYR